MIDSVQYFFWIALFLKKRRNVLKREVEIEAELSIKMTDFFPLFFLLYLRAYFSEE